MIGKTLGHYEVLDELGAGGMGEVYRARDGKLGRDVAIKVLPAHLADDPERLARLQREAQVLASLNHPNIAAIYGLEEATVVFGDDGDRGDGTEGGEGDDGSPGTEGSDGDRGAGGGDGGETTINFLVMELAPGETIAKRLTQGAIGVDEALKMALQIAEALEAAHDAGIVHRDLKPANVQVSTEGSGAGQVKVLDFGLAKALEADGASQELSPDLSASPTMAAATRTGMIMGTAAFMSPEQARGKQIDKRTDIWAFGCVLFEMLTGQRAFRGETVTDILAAIVHQEPQWEALPADTPLRIRDMLQRCLKKQPDERLRDVGECRIAVKEYLADPEGEKKRALAAGGGAVAVASGMSWKMLAPMIAAPVVVAVLATWWLAQAPAAPIMRFDIDLPPEVNFTRTGRHVLAFSPDGTSIVFVANRQLWMRRIGDLEATPIAGTDDDPFSPFFSPDGQQIGFFAQGQMKRVAISGGAAVSLGPADNAPFGASWGDNGMVYFGQGGGGIWQVPGTGGTPEMVVEMAEGEFADGPQLLPGGEWLLFALAGSAQGWNNADIVAQSLLSGERKLLIPGGTQPRYVPTGHLMYAHDGTLFAVPFDAGSLEVTPGPVPVVQGVRAAGFTGAVDYGFSTTGHLAYVPGTGGGELTVGASLVWVDREGSVEALPVEPRIFIEPRLSPDESRIAVQVGSDDDSDIWVFEVERGAAQRLTVEGDVNWNAVWSHDGEWVYFASDRGGDLDIWRKRADRSGAAEIVLEAAEDQHPHSVSADGETLFYTELDSSGAKIGMLSLVGDGEPEMLVESEAFNVDPWPSPDGRFVAFGTNESGDREVVVVEIDSGRRWPISTDGGRTPVWSRDGSAILYYEGAGRWYSVAVSTEPTFSAGVPQQIVQLARNTASELNVSADTQRFLTVRFGDTADQQEQTFEPGVHVVLNWFQELKDLVPKGR